MPALPRSRRCGRRAARVRALTLAAAAAVALATLLGRPGGGAPLRAETLTLADCLREVIDHNPQVAEQRDSLQQATGERLVYDARALPQLTVSAQAGQQGAQQAEKLRAYQRGTGSGLVIGARQRIERPSRIFTFLTGNGFQPLFDFAIPASHRRGLLTVEIAKQNFYVVATAELHAARVAYEQALFARDDERLLRRIQGRFRENQSAQENLFRSGLASRLTAVQATVATNGLRPSIDDLQRTYRLALLELLGHLGRNLSDHPAAGGRRGLLDDLTLAGGLDVDAPSRSFDLAAATAQALEQRPDLRSLRASLAATREDTRINRGGFYPVLRLYSDGLVLPQAAVRTNRQAIRPGDDVRVSELRYGPDFNWNPVDNGTTRGAVQYFEAAAATLELQLRGQEESLPRQLAQAHLRLETAARRRQALREGQPAAEQTLNAVRQAVVQGTSSQYELALAEADFLLNQNSLLSTAYEESVQAAEVDRLTGAYLRYVPTPETLPRPAAARAK